MRGLVSKWTIYTLLMCLSLISCSKLVKFERTLPEKIKYNKVSYFECNPKINGVLCIKNTDAINSVLDLKECQNQNMLLREMLNGN